MTLEEKRLLALKFMKSNNIKDFSKFYKIYSLSNENLTELFDVDYISNKKVLITGSSADQIITSQLYSPLKITHFDINPFVSHMYNLKIAAIKELNIEEYINFFYHTFDNYMSLDIDTYKRIRHNIEKNSLEFWDSVFRCFSSNIEKESLFMMNDNEIRNKIKNTLPYLSRENYLKIKYKKLVSVDFIECNILDLVNVIKEKYDLIYFSDILNKNEMTEFYNKNYIKNVYKFMRDILKYTNENGKIIINYFHNTMKEDLKKDNYHYINLPIRMFNIKDNISYLEIKSNTKYLKDTALVYTKKM